MAYEQIILGANSVRFTSGEDGIFLFVYFFKSIIVARVVRTRTYKRAPFACAPS